MDFLLFQLIQGWLIQGHISCLKCLDELYSSKELILEDFISLQNYPCDKSLQRQTNPFLCTRAGIFCFFRFCSEKKAVFLLCFVFLVPGTRAVDRSLDCILRNPADGRENVTLITSEKNRLRRSLNSNFFFFFSCYWLVLTAMMELPSHHRTALAVVGCPSGEMP